jgi:hypothetical protein
MRRIITTFALLLSSVGAFSVTPEMPKLGGYIIGRYDYSDAAGQSTNGGFDLRLLRLQVDGTVAPDFYYKVQVQMNGSPGSEKGIRVVDAFAEWRKYSYARIKLGEFKRCFTFENQYHPWNVGFGAYSQLVDKLASMNDRVGESPSNGRDLGIAVLGDLFKIGKDKHNLLFYQVGVYNGQGINYSDKDKKKDVIATLQVSPVKPLQLGVFGWTGSYTKDAIQVDRNRWGVGIKYESDWTVRTEYVASEGHKISDYDTETKQLKSTAARDKSDAWYVMVGVPVCDKFKAYAKWDVYRDEKTHASQKTIWGIGLNYELSKHVKLQGNYNFVDDNTSTTDQHYNKLDVQLYVKF